MVTRLVSRHCAKFRVNAAKICHRVPNFWYHVFLCVSGTFEKSSRYILGGYSNVSVEYDFYFMSEVKICHFTNEIKAIFNRNV